MMKFYEGCTALITGASSGLGMECARQLGPYARKLVLVARRKERLESLKTELEQLHSGLEVTAYQVDLRDSEGRVEMVNWLAQNNMTVNLLVNNAGVGDHGEFATGSWERVKAMLELNMMAVTHLTHLLLPGMREAGRAAILNVSSVAGFFPIPSMAVYAATKAYVTSLSESLAIELRRHGITVTALCPGPVPTEFFATAEREAGRHAHVKTMPAFVVSPEEVVREGLLAVARGRERVVPGILLRLAVGAALLVPFFITREILRLKSKQL